MIDLHLFLGRRPTTSLLPPSSSSSSDGDTTMKAKNTCISYSLSEMTPEMVHFGSIPESIMTAQVEHVNHLSDNIQSLSKVCENAMKQYRRTRPPASKNAVQRAKAILDGQLSLDIHGGTPVIPGGAIPNHPLFVHELQGLDATDTGSHALTLHSRANIQKREDFLRSLSQFRPKESVFEAFATGGVGKQTGVMSQVDKGRTTLSESKKKNDSNTALTAMKNMRRQMRMVRDKACVVAGSETALTDENDHEQQDNDGGAENSDSKQAASSMKQEGSHIVNLDSAALGSALIEGKRRMSKAERKRMRMDPNSTMTSEAMQMSSSKKKKDMRSADFRDPSFFIENDFTSNHEEAYRSRQVEAAMQPSSSTTGKNASSMVGAAARIEEAMLDIVGDENDELVKRQRMMRWDKSKRKYVQTTVGAELSGDSKSKRMRLESGQVVKNDKLKLGELYEKWQKKTNRSIGRTGVFDDIDGAASPPDTNSKKRPGRGGDVPKSKKAKHKDPSGTKSHGGGKSKGKNDDGNIKTAEQIKKDRAKASNMKLKNMKRSDRRSLEQKQKTGNSNNSKHNSSNSSSRSKTSKPIHSKKRK